MSEPKLFSSYVPTPFGPWIVSATEEAVVACGPRLDPTLGSVRQEDNHPVLNLARQELTEYFLGRRRQFTLPVCFPRGTDFQRRAWGALGHIPFGETWSYREQAEFLKNKNAKRAVGAANGQNPLLILVPCHRVVSSSGGWGGYVAGLAVKRFLLEHERRHL